MKLRGLTTVLIGTAIVVGLMPAAATANRAPSKPNIGLPNQSIDGSLYANADNLLVGGVSSDPDPADDYLHYRIRIGFYGATRYAYDSGWFGEATGWGGVKRVQPSANGVWPGMTYVLTVQARDPHGAVSPVASRYLTVFSNHQPGPAGSGLWYWEYQRLSTPRSAYNTYLARADQGYLRQYVYNLPDPRTESCSNSVARLPSGFRSKIGTRSIPRLGNVTGMSVGLNSVDAVMKEIRVKEPALANILRTVGMLCYRRIAGSSTTSNHSWGLAIDLTALCPFWDCGVLAAERGAGTGTARRFIMRARPYFYWARWFWGGGFSTQDNMHFEASIGLIHHWRHLGIVRYP